MVCLPPRPCARLPPILNISGRADRRDPGAAHLGIGADPSPHVHGIVPGGWLSPDGERWVACKPGFFLPVRRFLEALTQAHRSGQLQFFVEHAALADATAFADWLAPLRKCEWVVYAKRPFAGRAGGGAGVSVIAASPVHSRAASSFLAVSKSVAADHKQTIENRRVKTHPPARFSHLVRLPARRSFRGHPASSSAGGSREEKRRGAALVIHSFRG